MSEIFTGICIGGPLAGQWRSCDVRHFRIAKAPPIQLVGNRLAPMAAEVHGYRFEARVIVHDHQQIDAWLHSTIADGWHAVRTVFSAYQAQDPRLEQCREALAGIRQHAEEQILDTLADMQEGGDGSGLDKWTAVIDALEYFS